MYLLMVLSVSILRCIEIIVPAILSFYTPITTNLCLPLNTTGKNFPARAINKFVLIHLHRRRPFNHYNESYKIQDKKTN